MVNNTELRGALQMVLARLEADKHSSEEWGAIRKALLESANYAGKCATMRSKVEQMQRKALQDAHGAWREAERNAAGQRLGGRESEHTRNVVRETAKAYVKACETVGQPPGGAALNAAKDD